MATVTRKFRDDFDTWAAHRIEVGDWTPEEMAEFRGSIRQDLAPGPDLLRAGLVVIVGGVEMPAAIEDHEERYRSWAAFFDVEAEAIRKLSLRSEAKR